MTVRSWFCAIAIVISIGCAASTRLAGVTEVTDPGARRITIEAARHRFDPDHMQARVGETVTLVFTRTDEDRCLQRVVLFVESDRRIERDLPMRKPIAITLRLDRPGEVGITCAKGGHAAALLVEP